jgi:hypothetical protein
MFAHHSYGKKSLSAEEVFTFKEDKEASRRKAFEKCFKEKEAIVASQRISPRGFFVTPVLKY